MPIPSTSVPDDGLELRPLAVTVATAGRLTGLGNTTLWALIKQGVLQTTSVGRRRLVLYRSIERLLVSPTPIAPGHLGRTRKQQPTAMDTSGP